MKNIIAFARREQTLPVSDEDAALFEQAVATEDERRPDLTETNRNAVSRVIGKHRAEAEKLAGEIADRQERLRQVELGIKAYEAAAAVFHADTQPAIAAE